MRTALAASLLLLAVPAAADPSPDYALGVRVGGYGFRREGDTSSDSWNQCRMNGLGLFANRSLRGPLFVEAGLDAYFTAGAPPASDLPIDRQSGLVSAAIGARSQLASWLRGYVQVGAGVELTRVAVPYGEAGTIRDSKLLPDGFFGVGGDLRLARGTYLGATLRAHVMGNFDYDPKKLQMSNQWVAAPTPGTVFAASPDLAMQAQFYIRRDL